MTNRREQCCYIRLDKLPKKCLTQFQKQEMALPQLWKSLTTISHQKNVTYEIFQFRKAIQQSGETVDQFATRLRKLASTCEFTDLAKELKSTIIQNCQSKHLRRVALREELSLDALFYKARSQEACEKQAKGIEQMQSTSEAVYVLQYNKPPPRDWQSPRKKKQKVRIHVVIVDFCGPVRMACVQQKVKHATSVGK